MKSKEATSKAILREDKRVAEEISPKKKAGFPIAEIGSPAGGIEAVKQFLRAMPDRTGMAVEDTMGKYSDLFKPLDLKLEMYEPEGLDQPPERKKPVERGITMDP